MRRHLSRILSLILVLTLAVDPVRPALFGKTALPVPSTASTSLERALFQENALSGRALSPLRRILPYCSSFSERLKEHTSNPTIAPRFLRPWETLALNLAACALYASNLIPSATKFLGTQNLLTEPVVTVQLTQAIGVVVLLAVVVATFYVIIFSLTLLYRWFEPADDTRSLPPGLESRFDWETHVLYTTEEASGKLRIIPGRTIQATSPPTEALATKIARAKVILLADMEGAYPFYRAARPFQSTLSAWILEVGMRARTLFLIMIPKQYLSHISRLIPFAPIDFHRALSNMHVQVLTDTSLENMEVIFGSDLETLLYVNRQVMERLTEVELAGLIARKTFEMQAKRIVRNYNLSWVPVVRRVEQIAKSIEIQIAGPGPEPGTSAVDTALEKIRNPQGAVRLFVSAIPTSGNETLDILAGISSQLADSQKPHSTSRERTWAWVAALGALEHILDADPSEFRAVHDQITSFEITLWRELHAGAKDIDIDLNPMFITLFKALLKRAHPSERFQTELEGLQRLHPKDMLAYAISSFMLKRRGSPMDLIEFWLQGKPERRVNIALTMEAFYTDFSVQIEHILDDVSYALQRTSGMDQNQLVGQFAALMRYIASRTEDLTDKKPKQRAKHALATMSLDLQRTTSPIGNKAYKAPRYALNDIERTAEATARENPLPLLGDSAAPVVIEEGWRNMVHKYLNVSQDAVMEHCLQAALVVLERTSGDKQAALDASFQAYQRDGLMARALKSLKLSMRLQSLFLNGPGRLAFGTWGPEGSTSTRQANKRARRILIEVSREPIETSLMGIGSGRSLDFMSSRFFNINHLRAYIRHPRLRVLYAYEELPDGSKGARLARLAIALTKHRELLAISHIVFYGKGLALYYPFLAYLKNWSDSTGFPVIFWASENTKWADALGYTSKSGPFEATIPDIGSGDSMVLHSDLTQENPSFPVSVNLGAYLHYDPAPHKEDVSEPASAQEGFFAVLSTIAGLAIAPNHALTVLSIAGLSYLMHAGVHLALGGKVNPLRKGGRAFDWFMNGLREQPPANASSARLLMFYFLPGALQFIGGSVLLGVTSHIPLLAAAGLINVVQGLTIFFGADARAGRKHIPPALRYLRSA